MLLPDHKKIVYLPHVEYRLISALYNLSCDGIHYCTYKKYFETLQNKFGGIPHLYNWYLYTKNAYYDLAISNWCKLFGSYSEPTHYYHLLSTHALKSKLIKINIFPANKKNLKQNILLYAHINEMKFNQYHQLTKDYRDRNLIHREHSPKHINDGDLYYPRLKIAKQSFLSLTLMLIKLANTFPTSKDEINLYQFIYDDLHNKEQICALINKSIPTFIEKNLRGNDYG